MPLPKPNSGESHDDFMSRCMGNDVMVEEYPDNDQRYAVCQSLWDDRSDKAKKEVRIIRDEDLEMRVEKKNGKSKLIGYAARFNKWSEDLGFFREKIAPGAFTNAIETSDVRALKNHDANLLLGRTSAGTLRLTENTKGLKFEVDIPNTSTGKDTAEEVSRGDITGCSFAFTVESDTWVYPENSVELAERTINQVGQLFDVGPVTWPAYPDTSVAARSLAVVMKDKSEMAPVASADEASQSLENRDYEGIALDFKAKEKIADEPEQLDPETCKRVERGYRHAGRIIDRCRQAES